MPVIILYCNYSVDFRILLWTINYYFESTIDDTLIPLIIDKQFSVFSTQNKIGICVNNWNILITGNIKKFASWRILIANH